MKKAVLSWSGGKDSTVALYKILQESEYEVVSLLTLVDKHTELSSFHQIPISLLQQQAVYPLIL